MGLQALRARKIESFVYDKPLLAWTVQQHLSSSIDVLDMTFETQHYAICDPQWQSVEGSSQLHNSGRNTERLVAANHISLSRPEGKLKDLSPRRWRWRA
jgi:hypothetical protein